MFAAAENLWGHARAASATADARSAKLAQENLSFGGSAMRRLFAWHVPRSTLLLLLECVCPIVGCGGPPASHGSARVRETVPQHQPEPPDPNLLASTPEGEAQLLEHLRSRL